MINVSIVTLAPSLDETGPQARNEKVWSSSVQLGVPLFILRFNYFMLNHWWIPYNLMRDVIWWLAESAWELAESVYKVCWCVQFCPLCHLLSYKLLNPELFSLSILLLLGVHFASYWQIQPYIWRHPLRNFFVAHVGCMIFHIIVSDILEM